MENVKNLNTLVLTDEEVQLLSFFIDMKFPEFLAEDEAKDMFCIAAISKVFSWCQEIMLAHNIDALPYNTYKEETEEDWNRLMAGLLDYLAKKNDPVCDSNDESATAE